MRVPPPDSLTMELKAWRDGARDPLENGLMQLERRLARLSLDRGCLVIFDQRTGQPPIAERTRTENAQTPGGQKATVIRA